LNEFGFVMQLALGTVFLLSSVGKLRHPGRFARGLAAYRMLPASWAKLTSYFVIALESLLAASHFTGYLLAVALPLGLGLLGSFSIAVSVNLKRGRALPCYCFGPSDHIISGTTLARLALIASGQAFLLRMHRPIYLQQISLLQLGFASFWALLILIAALWILSLRDLEGLLRPIQ